MPQISKKLLDEWKKDGKILVIWRCERCYKKVPFYRTKNPLINSIYLAFAENEKYCWRCKKKVNYLKS